MKYSDLYLTYKGLAPKRVPHWENMSNPDAESLITGIDYYKYPRSCRLEMKRLYPEILLNIPDDDTPVPRPEEIFGDKSSVLLDNGEVAVRWGDGATRHWNHGSRFQTVEDVMSFSPLEQGNFEGMVVAEDFDYSDESKLYDMFRSRYPAQWGDKAPEGSTDFAFFYNTMFMWPLLTFGWELFMLTCLEDEFERIMNEFAELSRRVFQVFARLPVNLIICHDDIATTRGPICSPEWMNKYIYPRYEEFWDIVKKEGKQVVFVADGNLNELVDNIITCGASGIKSEPYTDYKAIAKRHKDCVIAGEGDNRVLMTNDSCQIKAMVDSMVETAKMCGGYFMSVGNHIPWDVPPEAVKLYLEYSAEKAFR